MSYRSYLLHSRPTATCASCGRTVRLRGWPKLVTAGGLILLALLVAVFLAESMRLFLIVTAALAGAALLVDYLGYRRLVWEPADDVATAPPPAPAAR